MRKRARHRELQLSNYHVCKFQFKTYFGSCVFWGVFRLSARLQGFCWGFFYSFVYSLLVCFRRCFKMDALIHKDISKDIICIPQDMRSLQTSMSAASAWAQSRRGRFSPAKTVVLPLGNLATNACQQFPLSIDEENIDIVDTHKHLGVILSTYLKWKAHLESILAKARKRAGLLRHVHVSHQLPAKLTCHLYTTYVRPMMEYACPVWHSSASAVDALSLERVQASVARTILAADWDTPKDILFRQLDWPTLRWRRTILSMTLFHQLVYHGEGPLIECMFQLSSATGSSIRRPHQLILGMASSTKRLNGFFYSAAILWNTLPAKIQNITNPRLFRASLENRLSRQKYNPLQNQDH